MPSAKTTIAIDDRSTNVVSLAGVTIGLPVNSRKGIPFKDILITNTTQLADYCGDPHPSLGTTLYAAKRYLKQGNALRLVRAVSASAVSGAALMRGKIKDVPSDFVGDLPDESKIILGLKGGVKWDDADTFVFPTYLTNRVYADPKVKVAAPSANTNKLYVNSVVEFTPGDKISYVDASVTLESLNDPTTGVGEATDFYDIQSIFDGIVKKEVIIVDKPVTASKGTEVKFMDAGTGVATSFSPPIMILEDVKASNTVVVSDSDLIDPALQISIVVGSTPTTFNVTKKHIADVPTKYLVLDKNVITPSVMDQKVLIIENYEYEDNDAFLVYATPGVWSKDVSFGTAPSKDYPDNAFFLIIYLKGAEVERHEVTLDHYVNGFNSQMFIESVVNSRSKYVRVLRNTNNDDKLPLMTDHAYWLRNPEDIFRDTTISVTEDVLVGHTQIWLDNVGTLTIGDRIKLKHGQPAVLGEEYKIIRIEGKSVIIDRKSTLNYDRTYPIKVFKFDKNFDDEPNGIRDGIQYFKLTKLDKVYPSNLVGDSLVISGTVGKLVDTGTGHLLGGNDGASVSLGEMIQAANVLKSRGNTPINIITDGGLAVPAYGQALLEVAQAQEDCHAFLSNQMEAEQAADPVGATKAYRISLGIDNRQASLFAGWVQQFDEINQVYVWECPAIFAVNAQSYVTRAKTIFTPAAGYVNGQVTGLNVLYKFDEGQMDELVDNQINPIKYDAGTIVIWGNETLLKRPSPLQLRSVNMLLIALQVGVRGLNEYKLFDFNNESTWDPLRGAVEAFLRDDFHAKGGLYDYKVIMSPSDLDIDNRRAPLWIGIQPTMDIKTIPTTIAIFNKSAEIKA